VTPAKRKAASLGAAALVLGATLFVLGGHSSYSARNHKLSMSAGSTDQINCNGEALNWQQLSPTIGRVQCTPSPTSTTTTTVVPGSSTTLMPPTTLPPPDVCPLTIAGRQCWAAKTGVPGWSEAQILAGLSPLAHTVGDRTITQDGTIIDGQWIDGCLAIKANNVTIINSYVRSGNWCVGGDGQSGPAVISTGACHDQTRSPKNLRIIDSEVTAGNVGQTSLNGISTCNYSLLRVNVHGGAQTVWTASNVQINDSYIHDPSSNSAPGHTEAVDGDSGTNVQIVHNWISAVTVPVAASQTGGIALNNSWGPASFFTITDNFIEGGQGADINFGATGRAWSTATNITFTGNRLSPVTAYGTSYFYGWNSSLPGMVWADILQSETLQPLNP
jgi:hypothetical protein